MSRAPFALDVALAQFTEWDVPTVIVPVARDGAAGVFYASYHGDAGWLEQARAEDNQAEVAIACCKCAYADTRVCCGAHTRTPAGRR